MTRRRPDPPARPQKHFPTVGTIDLHGYRKAQALSALTRFLENVAKRGKCSRASSARFANNANAGRAMWVLVVTGSGAHSPEGPVLREAIKNLLTKRRMSFFLNAGNGSFTVDANSGITLYAPPTPVDSKILLKPASERPDNIQLVRRAAAIMAASKKNQTSVLPAIPPSYDPSPAEVARRDAAVAASRTRLQNAARIEKKERNQLKKAIELSKAEKHSTPQAAQAEAEARAELERVLAMSQEDYAKAMQELEKIGKEQDEEIQAILRISEEEYEQKQTKLQEYADAQADIGKILELSREEFENSSRHCDDDDKDLLRVLELSKSDHATTPALEEEEDYLRAIEASIHYEFPDNSSSSENSGVDEDEELRRALELSLQDSNVLDGLVLSHIRTTDKDSHWGQMTGQVERKYNTENSSSTGTEDGGDTPLLFKNDLYPSSLRAEAHRNYSAKYHSGIKEVPLEYPASKGGVAFVD